MSFIELTQVPFGVFQARASSVGAVTPSESDPFFGMYNGQPYGCCVLIQGVEYRVRESFHEVMEAIRRAEVPMILGDTPVEPPAVAEVVKTTFTAPPKKVRKK